MRSIDNELPEVESVLQNSTLHAAGATAAIDNACELIVRGSQPLKHNKYKIPLVSGLLREALQQKY